MATGWIWNSTWSGIIPLSSSGTLGLLGEFLSIQSQRAAVIVDYVETLAPEGDMSSLSG